jgi:hypothetical protein
VNLLTTSKPSKEPIRWTGVVFALAANLLLVTIADLIAGPTGSTTAATVIAPLIAGGATSIYTRTRGGLHALIGALIALPLIALINFPTAWPLAIFATLFCTMGAALTELALRQQANSK